MTSKQKRVSADSSIDRVETTSGCFEGTNEFSDDDVDDGVSGTAEFGFSDVFHLDYLQLHPAHHDASGFGYAPVTMHMSSTPQSFADSFAEDERLISNPLAVSNVTISLKDGRLLVDSEDCIFSIPLSFTKVGISVCLDNKSLVALVPAVDWDDASSRNGSGNSNSWESSDGLSGWLLVCPRDHLRGFQELLGRHGCIQTSLEDIYILDASVRSIEGGHSTVLFGRRVGAPRSLVVAKALTAGTDCETIRKEVDMLLAAQGHPGIIQLQAVFTDSEKYPLKSRGLSERWFLILDAYPRGDLYDQIALASSMMSEELCLVAMHSLLSILCHLKDRCVFHRDIKPENLLVRDNFPWDGLVLTDFGIATRADDVVALSSTEGSLGYSAPEMIRGESIGCQGDAFGAGVVMYFMVSRSTPFYSPCAGRCRELTELCEVNVDYGCFQRITENCLQLMLSLLTKNPAERLTPHSAMMYPCMREAQHRLGSLQAQRPANLRLQSG